MKTGLMMIFLLMAGVSYGQLKVTQPIRYYKQATFDVSPIIPYGVDDAQAISKGQADAAFFAKTDPMSLSSVLQGGELTRILQKIQPDSTKTKAIPLFSTLYKANTQLYSNRTFASMIYIEYPTTLNAVTYAMVTVGNYTAANFNGFALYKLTSANTITRVAITANVGDIWKVAEGQKAVAKFTSPYAAATGVYYICTLYSNSAETTAPAISFSPTDPYLNSIIGLPANFITYFSSFPSTIDLATVVTSGYSLNLFLR